MVQESIRARAMLSLAGISAAVINIHTIKPIDEELILKASQETDLIVTVEDHNIIGGLGSAVTEVLTRKNPKKVLRLGVPDIFASSGKGDELLKAFGLSAEGIAKRIENEFTFGLN